MFRVLYHVQAGQIGVLQNALQGIRDYDVGFRGDDHLWIDPLIPLMADGIFQLQQFENVVYCRVGSRRLPVVAMEIDRPKRLHRLHQLHYLDELIADAFSRFRFCRRGRDRSGGGQGCRCGLRGGSGRRLRCIGRWRRRFRRFRRRNEFGRWCWLQWRCGIAATGGYEQKD